MRTVPRIVKQTTMRPPITPPTIAPTFVGSCVEGADIEADVRELDEELVAELELDAGKEDVSTTVTVGSEAGLVEELLGEGIVLSTVVCTATFGAGNSLSVRASAPQAMYSKD